MPIDRALPNDDSDFPSGGLDVLDQPPMEPGRLLPLPDGGAEVHFGGDVGSRSHDSIFNTNLAEVLSDQYLYSLANDLRSAVDEDAGGRKEWEAALTDGMDLLGIKTADRTIPWAGACGVVHPMILEAAVRFQSKSITRLFPADGPAQVKVIGESGQSKLAQAKRVGADINHWIVERMPEYRDETEQLLFALPVDGSAFRKIYFDPLLKRPVAQFVPASDFIMPYGFPNLETCPRYCHQLKQSFADIQRLQGRGFYRDVPLSQTPISLDRIEEKVTRLGGVSPGYSTNDLLTLREIHADLLIEELGDSDEPAPYIVTVETVSNQVLALRRNWREGDPDKKKIQYFCHYRYVPWKGAYGLGLIHLIGGIGKGSTSILRQLVDAGTLANLPGGLKTRGMRVKGDSDPIMPGEWRDVDIPAGKISDCVYPLPYKEPSAVLFSLLQMLVAEGKSFASIAELDITTSSQNAPVGTMLALIERATEVISAVQARLHTTLGRELTILAEIIRDYTAPAYDYEPVNASRKDKKQDYAQQVSIVPVSDPASATMAQRVMEYQAAMQLSAQAPQLYNLPLLHRSMLEVLGIDNADQIVPDKTEVDPMDPVAENMAIMTSKPVRAFEWQNHQAHMQCHQAFMQDPKIQQGLGQSPLMPSIMSAAQSHLAEHMAFQYRKDIETQMGVPLPASSTKLPAEVEEQLSGLQAQAAQKLLAADQAAAQQAQQAQQGQDPVLQLQQQELQVKQSAVQQKAQSDAAKLQLEQQKLAQKAQSDAAKLASAEHRTGAEIQGDIQRTMIQSGATHAGIVSGERQGALKHLLEMHHKEQDRQQPAEPPFTPAPETTE